VLLLLFFSATSTPESYPLSLHDALPILQHEGPCVYAQVGQRPLVAHRHRHLRAFAGLDELRHGLRIAKRPGQDAFHALRQRGLRSEEHTSELQSRENLVCRLLLEKKKRK